MITRLSSPRDAAVWCDRMRRNGLSIGYVPTMGALHEGHLALVRNAAANNDVCCASIFVNPLQFNDPADLEKYPVDLEKDCLLLHKTGCNMVYTGSLRQFFPNSPDTGAIPLLDAGRGASGLEGDWRPGHLEGVATIVDRLFRTVGDCSAYFGEKDFQQTLVVRELANNLACENIKINVVVHPTVRESSGLALSSRNQRLSQRQKTIAPKIHEALCAARHAWQNGSRDPAGLEKIMRRILRRPEIRLEYAVIRDGAHWSRHTPSAGIQSPRALIAVRLGEVRLIDNLFLEEESAFRGFSTSTGKTRRNTASSAKCSR